MGTFTSGRASPPLERQAGVAHRMDPAVNPMQPAVADPCADGAAREPARQQLIEREHAPLTGRPPSDQHVGPRVEFGGLSGNNSTSAATNGSHAGTVPGLPSRVRRECDVSTERPLL
jgi:hypothetical protein